MNDFIKYCQMMGGTVDAYPGWARIFYACETLADDCVEAIDSFGIIFLDRGFDEHWWVEVLV